MLSRVREARVGDPVAYGPDLQGYDYPFPLSTFAFTSQRQPLTMAYLDVKPTHASGRVLRGDSHEHRYAETADVMACGSVFAIRRLWLTSSGTTSRSWRRRRRTA